MAAKLSEITPAYHSFTNDQLLTAKQLNEFLSYFEDQDRLSRICLTGVGIVCGFELSYDNLAKTVTVTQGVGVTTDGDLIQFRKPVTTDPPQPADADPHKLLQEIDPTPRVYRYFREFTDNKATYKHFHNGNTQIKLYELFTDPLSDGSTSSLTTFGNSLSSMVALIYLESYIDPATACSGVNCDNLGELQAQNLRVLLVSPTDANYIIQNDPLYSKHFLFDTYEALPEIAMKRVVLNTINTASFSALKDAFRLVITDNTLLNNLKNSFNAIYARFGMSANATNIQTKINQLFLFNAANTPIDFQYRYDALKDLVDTYQEIKEQLLYLTTECSPNVAAFPKHLLLGKLTEVKPYSTYRHQFYASPALDINQRIKHFFSLLGRVEEMLNNYATTANFYDTAALKITPSVFAGKTENKSIPFYYNFTSAGLLLKRWNFEKTARFKQDTNLSYHTAQLNAAPHIQTPLLYNLDPYDFFRVEGYFAGSIDAAKTSIQTAITTSGLDFDVKVVEVKNTAESLNAMLLKHPSIEHKAGVEKGGTLLLVKNENKLVADFAINYRIPEEVKEGNDCCYYVECTYPWISTLKYINNLSRSLKGTQSEVKAMPAVYRLQVLEYSINDIPLINSPITIQIPLNEIFLRRLHVVMEKLNTTFPTGLVFEFLEEIKQFKVTKLERDTFRLVLRDTTLKANGPTYTYTEAGQLRNNKPFGNVYNTCKLIKMHHADTYLQLHETYDPINKDDDYGAFDEDWRNWEDLKKQLRHHPLFSGNNFTVRFPKVWNDLRPEIKQDLTTIISRITNIDANAKIDLYGDWPNGNWVDPRMTSYYNTHLNDKGDDVVTFIKLRKKLHNKHGISKYILHIKSNTSATTFQTGLADLLNKAEFYFQKPDEGNVIPVWPRTLGNGANGEITA